MDNLDTLHSRLEYFYDIGVSLSSEHDLDRLLEKILVAAKTITCADAGTLYLMSPNQRALQFKIIRTDSLGIAINIGHGDSAPPHFPDVQLYLPDGSPNLSMIAAYAAVKGVSVNLPDAYTAEGFDFTGTRKFDERSSYRSQSFLTIPMRNHEDEIIGVLQLINAKSSTGQTIPFPQADQKLSESLASQAAVAITNRQLINQMEKLFEATIQMINSAIDEKSPYTGGHCQRVPELTMLLAEAADEVESGPLADFKLTDRDRYELRIAALLHDCGKITTPVHVVDKSTKLETIYDRLSLVDTRFEAVKRTLEARMWKSVAQWRPLAEARASYLAEVEALEDDRAFIRKTNTGGEKMSDEDVDRVKAIAKRYPWEGPDGSPAPFLTDNEVENLTIRAGTLTTEERNIINKHISSTITMLEHLPWPKHLTRVPEYAGGHHERMDGKGYPKGLTREQMSVQARMMAIADIFEALTASDRPYKRPMKLSLALKIMENFKDTAHIDPDLYDVFIQSKVYAKYAEAHLSPEQMDV